MDPTTLLPKFTLECTKPLASDSPDHLVPRGTKNDNSRNRLFNRKVELLLTRRPLRIIDFGCAGGGFVKDCIDDGHHAVGLEGSDYSLRIGRAEWATIPQFLFTCDITAPLQLRDANGPVKVDLITGWEFMEHIPTDSIGAICANAAKHLNAGGLLIFSIADFRDEANGVVYHQTVQPKAWWIDKFRTLGFTHHENLAQYFGNDWIRGEYQGSQGFHVVMTRNNEPAPPIPSQGVPYIDLITTGVQFLEQGVKFNNTGGYYRNLEYALLCFDRAIQQQSTAEAHYGRAMTLIHLKQSDRAASDLRTAASLAPGNADIARALRKFGAAPVTAPSVSSTKLKSAHPKISIVTPTRNCAQYLPQCIESVLAQGYDNFEHIIVDGASTDNTVEILKSYPHIKWISEPDHGEAEALNKALKLATGDILTWLNADDYYVGHNVYKSVIATRAAHPEADVFFGNTLIIDDDENILEMRIPRIPLDMSQILCWFQDIRLFQPSIFYTRQVANTVGAYREDLYYSIDLEYWLRMAAAGFKFQHINQTLSKSRLNRPGAKSGGSALEQEKSWQEICNSFVHHLPPGEAFNFWKEYYRHRILTQHIHKTQIPVGDTFEATSGLCFALIQLNQIQPALAVAETLIARYPSAAESYWFASEALHKAGRHADAQSVAAQAVQHVPGGAILPLPRSKIAVEVAA